MNAPVKVVYIIDHLGLGGAQRQLVELIRALPRDRYDVQVISLARSPLTYYEAAIRRAGVPLLIMSRSGKWSWRLLPRLYRTLRRLQPAIVHTGLFTADFYGRLAARLAGVPTIISTVHNVDLDKPLRYVLVDRWLKHVTTWFVATADAVRTMANQREGVPTERTTVIYNGIDLRQFAPSSMNGDGRDVRRRAGVGPQGLLIGIIGRLAPVKDHATFLRAASAVHQAVPDSAFLIVGDGALKPSLERLVQELGLSECVSFLETHDRITSVYHAIDLLVVSSHYEGCCRVILEAMAMGKPVVATASGGNAELVAHGKTGVLVPTEDPRSLAEAVLTLARHRTRMQVMGRRGRQRVEQHFSLDQMAVHTDSLYQQLLDGANRTGRPAC